MSDWCHLMWPDPSFAMCLLIGDYKHPLGNYNQGSGYAKPPYCVDMVRI